MLHHWLILRIKSFPNKILNAQIKKNLGCHIMLNYYRTYASLRVSLFSGNIRNTRSHHTPVMVLWISSTYYRKCKTCSEPFFVEYIPNTQRTDYKINLCKNGWGWSLLIFAICLTKQLMLSNENWNLFLISRKIQHHVQCYSDSVTNIRYFTANGRKTDILLKLKSSASPV